MHDNTRALVDEIESKRRQRGVSTKPLFGFALSAGVVCSFMFSGGLPTPGTTDTASGPSITLDLSVVAEQVRFDDCNISGTDLRCRLQRTGGATLPALAFEALAYDEAGELLGRWAFPTSAPPRGMPATVTVYSSTDVAQIAAIEVLPRER